MQAEEAEEGEKVPAGHCVMQLLAPAALEDPTHGVHWLAPASEKLPARQVRHDEDALAPAAAEAVPAGQATQDVLPVRSE